MITVIILSCHAEAAMGSYQGGRAPMPLGWLRNGIGAPPAIPLGHPPRIYRGPLRATIGATALFFPRLFVSFIFSFYLCRVITLEVEAISRSGWVGPIYRKGVLDALYLTSWNLAVPN